MDTPTLIKIDAKRNAFLAAFFGFLIAAFIVGYLIMLGTFKLGLDSLIALGILAALCIVMGVLAAYYSTIVRGYSYLYGAEGNPTSRYSSTLSSVIRDRVIIPYSFIRVNEDFRTIYDDGLYSYLYGFSNAALPTIVRCLEIGLKEKYALLKSKQASIKGPDLRFVNEVDKRISEISTKRKRAADIEDVDLIDLTGSARSYYENKAEAVQLMRTLRNFIHGPSVIVPSYAHSALVEITSILNILFELPAEMPTTLTCKVCGNRHSYNIRKEMYFIGNKIGLDCKNPNIQEEERAFVVTLMPYDLIW